MFQISIVLVKASEEVSTQLLEKFKIPTTPVIVRGSEENDKVAKQFVTAVVDIVRRIKNFLKQTYRKI